MNGLGLVSMDHHFLALLSPWDDRLMIFNLLNETVETQLTDSVIPLPTKFSVASQRILNFSLNFCDYSLIAIIFFNYSGGIVNVYKKMQSFVLLKAGLSKKWLDLHHSCCFPFPEDPH
jgi:hypothetical protein